MLTLLRSPDDILAALRARKEQLAVSHETLDAIAGWAPGYASKLFCPVPMKHLGALSLPTLTGALGVALVMVEDTAAAERVRHLWIPRKRPQRLMLPASDSDR